MGRVANTSSIRVVTLEGNPWFNTKDVCLVLGFGEHPKGGFSHHLFRVDSDEKMSLKKVLPKSALWSVFEEHANRVSLISESGLYKLIMRSDKPQAKAFQDWVTKEVLPSIRKTGSFVTGQPSLVENPQMSALDLVDAQMGAMQEQARVQQEQLHTLTPQALHHLENL